MGDSTLDDFFAKKDKNKKSKTKKFMTSDEIGLVRKPDDGRKTGGDKVFKKDKVANSMSTSGGSSFLDSQQEKVEEWREIEDEEKDYTGLKIQNLQISDLRDEELEKEELMRERDGQKEFTGPWKVADNNPAPSPSLEPETGTPQEHVQQDVKTENRVESQKGSGNTGKYVPPHERESQQSVNVVRKTRGSNKAPEISSEEHFPTLGNAKASKQSAVRQEGGNPKKRSADKVNAKSENLMSGNKFEGQQEKS